MISGLNYKIESVRIDVAKNGFLVTVDYKSENLKKDDCYDYDAEEFVYETSEDAIKKMSDLLA